MSKPSLAFFFTILLCACTEDPSRMIVITSFHPEKEGPGNAVEINGKGFGESSQDIVVEFNGATAEIEFLSDSLLITRVPDEATSGPITIRFPDLSIQSEEDFIVLSGTWTKKRDLPVDKGFGASVGFAAQGLGYIGTGGNNGSVLDDFWLYDPVTDGWSGLPSIPNGARRFSSGFVLDDNAYVGLGTKDNETEITPEFYVFETSSQTWRRLQDFPSPLPTFRDTYASFTVSNNAYLLLQKELWTYDSEQDNWSQVSTFPGTGNANHIAETINDLAYIGLGFNNAFDWWRYDALTSQWTELSSFPGELTWGVTSFQIDGKIYVVGKQCWQYDPVLEQWLQMNSHPDGRRFATAFSIRNKAYLGTGISITESPGDFQKELWEFDPN